MKTIVAVVLLTLIQIYALGENQTDHSQGEKKEGSGRFIDETDKSSYEFLCRGKTGLVLVRDGSQKELVINQNGDWLLKDDKKVTIEEARVLEELTSLWGTTSPEYIQSMPEDSRKNILTFLERRKQSGADLEVVVVSNPETCPHCVTYEPTANRLRDRWRDRLAFRILRPGVDSTLNAGVQQYCQNKIPCTLFRKRSSGRFIAGLLGAQSEQAVETIINNNLPKEAPAEPKPLVKKKLKPCEEMGKEKVEKTKVSRKTVSAIKQNADGSLVFQQKDGQALTVQGKELPSNLSLDDSVGTAHFSDLSFDPSTKKGKLSWTECSGDSCMPKSKDVTVSF